MLSMVPRLGEYLAAVVTGVVPVVFGNLASKNAVICKTSEDILDSIIEHVGMLNLVKLSLLILESLHLSFTVVKIVVK